MNGIGPLKRYRHAHGMRFDAMCEALGVDRSQLSRIDRGLTWPSRDLCERIVKLTGGEVTPNDLLAPAPEQTEAA